MRYDEKAHHVISVLGGAVAVGVYRFGFSGPFDARSIQIAIFLFVVGSLVTGHVYHRFSQDE
ncbi:MAG TPA: hypothetical protein VF576_10020 [Rubricoccaceae bacterium]